MDDLLGLVEQCHQDSQRWFPDVANDPRFMALAMCGEAGEAAEYAKKMWRGSMTLDEAREQMAEEAVDVLIYVCNLFAILKVDPVEIYQRKRQKNELRFSKPGGDPQVDGARIFPDHGRREWWGAC